MQIWTIMKDIDTETTTKSAIAATATVVWPSWCYSDDIGKNLLKQSTDVAGKDTLRDELEIDLAESRTERTTQTKTKQIPTSGSRQHKLLKRESIGNKMLSERSLLLSGYNNNSIDGVKKSCELSNKTTPPTTPNLSTAQATSTPTLTVTPTTTAAAAAAYLYLEKVKNERMSPRVTAAQIDSLKDAIMESSAAAAAVAAAMVNNNNNSSSINNNNNNNSNNSGNTNSCNNSHSANSTVLSQNQIANSLNNNNNNTNTSDETPSHSLQSSIGPQHPHHQPASIHLSSNHVKRERLSPATGTNGDLQSALSRSRSTTPSSFRGPSPQHSVHSSPSETVVPMHNLSSNLLNSIQQAASSSGRQSNISFPNAVISSSASSLPSDFSTRNYSDFMRCLAAKYNNTNPTDSSNSRRQTFFDTTTTNNATKKTTSVSSKVPYPPPSTSISKEISITTTPTLPPPQPISSGAISPGDTSLSHAQQTQMAAAVASAAAANSASAGNVSPFMTSFLSSLPFAQGILPPLIDMSSTQALITLARAAKENEMHNILQMNQTLKRSSSSASPSPSPSLNMALQQAGQFITPALLYSAQAQKQQQQQVSSQSSPRSTHLPNTTSGAANNVLGKNAGDKRNASPLDLSSQPPASKRFKIESNTSSQSSSEGLLDATIKRRSSTSTPTTSPSPPPLNDRPTSPNAIEWTTATSSGLGVMSTRRCQAHSEEVNSWTVDDVCAFVGSIDICAEYVKHFRDQCIDGSGLPLLTEDHLVNSLGMKLGPALKLRSMLAKKLGGPCPCVSCVAQAQQMLALQTAVGITPTGGTPVTEKTANSFQPKSATTSGNDDANSNSNNSNNATSDKTLGVQATKTITPHTNASAAATTKNSSEHSSDTNCQINVATCPQSSQNKCNATSTNYSSIKTSNNNKSNASVRDDNNGSSSS
uniref:SAM domain-containing protein n=1 Tax=Musca domestica TaxID=7370 RepID=A0A1I8MTU6_MUSDO